MYSHSFGLAITGGFVYYGSAFPNLYGSYIYADYSSGRVWTMKYDGTAVTSGPTQVVDSAYNITGFDKGIRLATPEMSSSTDEVLASVGYSAEEIADMRKKGAI